MLSFLSVSNITWNHKQKKSQIGRLTKGGLKYVDLNKSAYD